MDSVKFGKFIRESRKEKGLTQKQLADLVHVSDKAVSKWENGAGFPDIKLLEPLAECLGVSPIELMQSEKIEEPKIDRTDAEQIVADTISQSQKEEDQKLWMWKVKVLLAACACGIFYLICVGIGYLLQQSRGIESKLVFDFQSGAWYENPLFFYLNGTALNVNDSAFINTAEHLRQVIDTVWAFFPFLLGLIVCVGYLITLLLLQSRKNEMALLRSIGLSKWKCFRIFFAEQLTLVITGIVAGSVLSVLIQGNYGGSSALTGCLVGICYMAGNSLALWKLLNVSVMEALFLTE